MNKGSNTTLYTVSWTTREAPDIVTLSLTDEDGKVPTFLPGQFINVYFPETDTPEGKAYSISSAPGERTFSITVRAIGEFSHRLARLRTGEAVRASLPYGFFRPERSESPLVMLASGIGITPFRSILRHAARETPGRRIALLHGARTIEDAVFREEFEMMKKTMPHLSLSYFVTREDAPPDPGLHARRMEAGDALKEAAGSNGPEFLLCGSIPFTRDMWRALRREGVPEDALYTEAFFSH